LCQERNDILYEEKCGLNFPDFIIFDLDPYIYSGQETKGQEPEYNYKGFRAAVEVAYLLKDFFDNLSRVFIPSLEPVGHFIAGST
jgi:bifunctional non-homologous end joining protein LigD